MKLFLMALITTVSLSAFAGEIKEPVKKGMIKLDPVATEVEALEAAFALEAQIVAGEVESAQTAARIGCAGYTRNVEYTKGYVKIKKAYVDSVAQYTAVVVYNYTCNFIKR